MAKTTFSSSQSKSLISMLKKLVNTKDKTKLDEKTQKQLLKLVKSTGKGNLYQALTRVDPKTRRAILRNETIQQIAPQIITSITSMGTAGITAGNYGGVDKIKTSGATDQNIQSGVSDSLDNSRDEDKESDDSSFVGNFGGV